MPVCLEPAAGFVIQELRPQVDRRPQAKDVSVKRLDLVPAIILCESAQRLLDGGARRDAQNEFGFARTKFAQHEHTEHYLAVLARKDAYLNVLQYRKVDSDERPPDAVAKKLILKLQNAALLIEDAVGKYHGDFVLAIYEMVDLLWWLGRKTEAKKLMAEARQLAAQSEAFPLALTLEGLLGWREAGRIRSKLCGAHPGSRM